MILSPRFNVFTGQMVGKAEWDPRARIFMNLPPGAINALWESFNDVADGFGISLCEMQLICQELTTELEISRSALNKHVQTLFNQIDSDENALVDGIEFLSTLAMASGMSFRDKLEFAFTCFDFDGAGQLSVDEITLAFRCTLMGLSKLTGETCPCEDEVELVAMRAFSFAKIDPNKNSPSIKSSVQEAKLRTLVNLGLVLFRRPIFVGPGCFLSL